MSQNVDRAHAAEQDQRGKKLVICLDGTHDAIGEGRPTNPAKVFRMLDLDQPERQRAYYDPGVGTLPRSTVGGKLGRQLSVLGQLAFGFGMTTNVIQAYTWLMNNYQPRDQVYVFGFSRGAFTARALVSMLESPGLLRSGSDNLVEYAVKQYAGRKALRTEGSGDFAKEFADSFCWGTASHPLVRELRGGMDLETEEDRIHAVPVRYVGVWDTVFAGVARNQWPGIKKMRNVEQLRHAVAIDERRWPYREVRVDASRGEHFEEAWFSGVHCDVGGTFKNFDLARIALKWVFDPVSSELLLRDREAASIYTKYCEVKEADAEAELGRNSPLWRVTELWRRHIPHEALIHQSVDKRMTAPKNLPRRYPPNYTDKDWTTPAVTADLPQQVVSAVATSARE